MSSIPHLVEVYETWAPRGVVFLALTDESPKVVEGGLSRKGVEVPGYPIGCQSRDGSKFGVRGIPAAFVIDHEGTIIWQGHPGSGGYVSVFEAALEKAADAGPSWDPGEVSAELSKVKELCKAGELGKAWAQCDKLLKKNPGLEKDVLSLKENLLHAGNRRITIAEDHVSLGRCQVALDYLEMQANAFSRTPIGETMKETLAGWKKDRGFKSLASLDKKLIKILADHRKGAERMKSIKKLKSLKEDCEGTPLADTVESNISQIRG